MAADVNVTTGAVAISFIIGSAFVVLLVSELLRGLAAVGLEVLSSSDILSREFVGSSMSTSIRCSRVCSVDGLL